jgi:hypothetical protein
MEECTFRYTTEVRSAGFRISARNFSRRLTFGYAPRVREQFERFKEEMKRPRVTACT